MEESRQKRCGIRPAQSPTSARRDPYFLRRTVAEDHSASRTAAREAAAAQPPHRFEKRRKPDNIRAGRRQRPAPPDTTAVTPPDTTGRPDPDPFPEKLPSPGRIPIVAWHGVRASQVSVARFREAAELGITVVFVTHDQEEAMALSHRIVVMNKGKFEQVGTPTEVYDNPATKYVASFIGEMNFIEKDGKTIAVRPEDVAITSEPADIQGCVRTIMVLGHYVEVNVQCGDLVVKCFVDRDQSERLTPGDPVNLKFLKTHIF